MYGLNFCRMTITSHRFKSSSIFENVINFFGLKLPKSLTNIFNSIITSRTLNIQLIFIPQKFRPVGLHS